MRSILRWLGGIAAAIVSTALVMFTIDVATDRVKFRTLVKRTRWAAVDTWHWVRRTWNRLPATLSYELGLSHARWVLLRQQWRDRAAEG